MQTMASDYYALLEVSKTATQDEIQKAYRKLARKYHPDLNPDDKAAKEKFKDIQHAHAVLSDPEKRKMYDQFGPDFERMGSGGPFQGGGPGQGSFSFEDLFGGSGPGGFQFDGDIGELFGQFRGRQAPPRGRRRSAPAKGNDLTAELTVPFNTAILGGEASIQVTRSGKNESIQVKIPPGIETGKKMRLRGQGEPVPNGPSGDLLVTLNVAPHPFFKRSGKNLELRLPVTITEAALGATIDIPTPGGVVALKIPAGSSGGRRLRIKGQGVLSSSGAPGDLYVELQVKVPEHLSSSEGPDEETQAAFRQIEKLYSGSVRDNIIW